MLAHKRVSILFMRTCEAGTERTVAAGSVADATDARSADGLRPGRLVLQIVITPESKQGPNEPSQTGAPKARWTHGVRTVCDRDVWYCK